MDCLFCKIAKGEEDADVVFENEEVIAFKDINPKASTHVLIVPKKHISSLKKIEEEHQQLLGKLMLVAKKIAAEKDADGYKVIMNVGESGGQQVEHIHLHLLIGEVKGLP